MAIKFAGGGGNARRFKGKDPVKGQLPPFYFKPGRDGGGYFQSAKLRPEDVAELKQLLDAGWNTLRIYIRDGKLDITIPEGVDIEKPILNVRIIPPAQPAPAKDPAPVDDCPF